MKLPWYLPASVLFLLAALALTPSLSGLNDRSDSEIIVASVNGVEIDRAEYLHQLESAAAVRQDHAVDELTESVINDIVIAELIYQENAEVYPDRNKLDVVRLALEREYSTVQDTSNDAARETDDARIRRLSDRQALLQQRKGVYLAYAQELKADSEIRVYWRRL